MDDAPAASGRSGTHDAISTSSSDPRTYDAGALARFDIFLLSAVATVLVVRSALAVTGYPQVGGGGLHIAHVLWGGLCMAIAIVAVEILPGSRVRRVAAFVGGIGFGLFIDEVGKFVTKDVDYFYKPAIAIIYATFIVFYLAVQELVRRRPLNDRQRLAIAAQALSDLALGQLDRISRNRALGLLEGVDDTAALATEAQALRAALTAQKPARPGFVTRLNTKIDAIEERAITVVSSTAARAIVLGACVLQALDLVVSLLLTLLHRGGPTRLHSLLDTGIPSIVSGALLVAGVATLFVGNRKRAIGLLEQAVVIDLLFTQVAVFNREQWLGLVGFSISLVVLWTLRAMRLRPKDGRLASAP